MTGADAILHGAVIVSPATLFWITLDSVLSCSTQMDVLWKWFLDLLYLKIFYPSNTLSKYGTRMGKSEDSRRALGQRQGRASPKVAPPLDPASRTQILGQEHPGCRAAYGQLRALQTRP